MFDTDKNRDGALIYSVTVVVKEFSSSTSIDLNRFEVIIRRLSSLLSVFAARISTPFHIANNAFFASSVCELLYEFESHCSSNLGTLQCFEKLRSSIDDFYTVVVKRLNEMALTKKVMNQRNGEVLRKALTPSQLRRSRSAVSFGDRVRKSRSLWLKDCNSNQKFIQKRRAGSCSARTFHSSAIRNNSDRLQKENSLKNGLMRWNESHITQMNRSAHRLAKEITNEIVNNLAEKVDKICTSRDAVASH